MYFGAYVWSDPFARYFRHRRLETTITRTRSLHFARAFLAAVVLAAVGLALFPATSAQASTESFSISVYGGYNNSQALGTATGTLTATGGGTSLQYSFQLCGQSTYPNSRITITAGSGSTTQYINSGACQTFSGTVTSSYGFSSASLALYGSTFYPGNEYTTYSKTKSVVFAGTPTPSVTPTPPSSVTNSFTVSVAGGYNNSQALGTATGTITATRGTTAATYSVTLCGQSTYPSSQVTISAGSATATHTVYYQNCQTFGGTLTSSYGISTASITVSGSTFYPGNTYQTYTKTKTVYF
jgi:hypothetical protein